MTTCHLTPCERVADIKVGDNLVLCARHYRQGDYR